MEASSLQSHFVNWQLLHRSRGMAKALDGREIVKVKLIPNFFPEGPSHVWIHSSMPTQQSMSKDTLKSA